MRERMKIKRDRKKENKEDQISRSSFFSFSDDDSSLFKSEAT